MSKTANTTAYVVSKPWWQSRTIWSGIVTVLVAVAALFGVAIPHELVLTGVMALISMASGAGAIVGRVTAKQPIKPSARSQQRLTQATEEALTRDTRIPQAHGKKKSYKNAGYSDWMSD